MNTITPAPSLALAQLPPEAKPVSGRPGHYTLGERRVEVVAGADGRPLRLRAINQRGGVSAEFQYQGAVGAATGGPVPAVCRARIKSGPNQYGDFTFRIEKYDVTTPQDLSAYLTDWNRQGTRIMDDRVFPPVGWSYEELLVANNRDPAMTPARLLELSRERSRYQAAVTAASQRRQRAEELKRTQAVVVSLLVVFGVAATVVGPFVWRRLRSRRLSGP
jgi:hypothetical protein